MSVRRIFVEKRPEFAVKAKELRDEIESYLGIKTVTGVRVLIRYDIENVSEAAYREALSTIFSEPPMDDVYEESFETGEGDTVFTVEYLPQSTRERLRRTVREALKRGGGTDHTLRHNVCGIRNTDRGGEGGCQVSLH